MQSLQHDATDVAQDDSLDETTATTSIQEPIAVNHAPVFLSEPVIKINSDQAYFYPSQAFDPDGDMLTWVLSNQTAGLSIDVASGVVYGSKLVPGSHSILLNVSDDRGGFDEQRFTLDVTQNPSIHSLAPAYTFTGYAYRYQVMATSADESTLIYSLETGPSGMYIDTDSGQLEWENPELGEHEVSITVSSVVGNSTTQSYSLNVLDENSLFFVSTPETVAYEAQSYSYKTSVLSLSQAQKTYTLIEAPPGMQIEEETGLISWVPESAGLYPVELTVVDVDGRTGHQEFQLQVRSLQEMDQLFNNIIRDVFDYLVAGDIESARALLSGEARVNYLPVLNALLLYMEEVIANLGAMERVSISNTSAEYIIPHTLDDETRMFIVTFVPGPEGVWKLNGL